jgi:hypothetical protein
MTARGSLRITLPIDPPLALDDYSYYVVNEALLDAELAHAWRESPISAGLGAVEPMPGHEDEEMTFDDACRWLPILQTAIRAEGRDIGPGVIESIVMDGGQSLWRIEVGLDGHLRSGDGSWEWPDPSSPPTTPIPPPPETAR